MKALEEEKKALEQRIKEALAVEGYSVAVEVEDINFEEKKVRTSVRVMPAIELEDYKGSIDPAIESRRVLCRVAERIGADFGYPVDLKYGGYEDNRYGLESGVIVAEIER